MITQQSDSNGKSIQSELAKIEEEEVEASPQKKTTKEDEITKHIGEISKLPISFFII